MQDLKMADQKRTKTEKAGLENDGPNRRAGKCRTWKMTDPGTSKMANNDTVWIKATSMELKHLVTVRTYNFQFFQTYTHFYAVV